MTNRTLLLTAFAAATMIASSCSMLGGKNKAGGSLPNDGQLHGVSPDAKWTPTRPFGMVYVPPGTFHMGPSDEDVNYSFTARNKSVSISGFWMDATEVTNNEYRQFTNWVRDSIAAKLMGFIKTGPDGNEYVDWTKAKNIKWGDKSTIEKIDAMIVTPDNRIFGKKELDAKKIVFHSEVFDYKAAAQNREAERNAFLAKSLKDVEGLSVAVLNKLSGAGITTLRDLKSNSMKKIDDIPGIGDVYMKEIKDFKNKHSL